jgi:hypothetical protein
VIVPVKGGLLVETGVDMFGVLVIVGVSVTVAVLVTVGVFWVGVGV